MSQELAILDRLADEFDSGWRSGERPDVEDYLKRVDQVLRLRLAELLIPLDIEYRIKSGQLVQPEDYAGLSQSMGEALSVEAALRIARQALQVSEAGQLRWEPSSENYRGPANSTHDDCQQDLPTGDYTSDDLAESQGAAGASEFVVREGRTPQPDCPTPPVSRIGRYRIERVLGRGGFGLVYLAHDGQLNRRVAIKVPHAHLIAAPENVSVYLTEARTVAGLDHPHIVPVYDVNSSAEFPCYIVSKFIEGMDLAALLKQKRMGYRQSAELISTIADALHYAHKQGLVHRDIKPGNILIGKDNQPYVVDFGLALREENIGQGPQFAGTPAYMSPEQARGEGHRVDGRSDIFSLGAVFYELLVGRRAFRGNTFPEVSEQIIRYEPRPPRQYDESIPKELERICHKALAKRATDRYSNGFDLAQDLRLFLQEQAQVNVVNSLATPTGVVTGDNDRISGDSSKAQSPTPTTPTTLAFADSQPVKIVPKGLRSFDAHDADFFLELLPGPRDREGLPDSLRFWRTRIEETDADNTFSVGLIYGPSGCGKSSLVKAGLLPRLSTDVIAVYIEATPRDTETRLLHGLRKRCSALDDNLSLKATLAALRRGQGIPVGKKVLIVLDQFEQWLHTKQEEENTDLVQALRQCDGGRVQCIVLVRDDFWLAVSRFLRELEVQLLEGRNIALVDLFDLDHARKVLSAFGSAFAKLPDNIGEMTTDQKDFLNQSVAGLAEEGKVICVRLALFAEMMKGKAWTSATLKEVGGTSGIGVTFLEETFSSAAASPEHRYHQKAARAVLKSLLPDSGTDIKGTMRSYAELLEASGYGSRPKDFDDLIRILDSEIRLITPTDPEGKDAELDSAAQTLSGQKYFQLTHDYLVPSLRDWLTRKQRETRRGRAELRLQERAATWNAKPEQRFLPSLWEYLNIRTLTKRQNWSDGERAMMSRATRFHALRSTLATVAMIGLLAVGLTIRSNVARQQEITSRLATMDEVGTEFERKLSSATMATDDWDELYAIADRIQTLSAPRGPEARERINLQLAAKIQAQLVRPRLDADAVNDLEAAIRYLEARSRPRALQLREALAGRLRITLFSYSAGDDIATAFDPSLVVSTPSGAARDLTHVSVPVRDVLTNYDSIGDVELEATVAKGWEQASELALLLHARLEANDSFRGYRFELRTVAPRSEALPTFAEARERSQSVQLVIRRDSQTLKVASLPAASLPDRELRLRVRRQGNRVAFQVDERQPMTHEELFWSIDRTVGRFGLGWPAEVVVTRIQASRPASSSASSSLEAGDTLYSAGQFDAALAQYELQNEQESAPELLAEITYKRALCLFALRRADEAYALLQPLMVSQGSWSRLAGIQVWISYIEQSRWDDADAIFDSLSTREDFVELAAQIPPAIRNDMLARYRGLADVYGLRRNPNRVRSLERARDLLLATGAELWEISEARIMLIGAYERANRLHEARSEAEYLLNHPGLSPEGRCRLTDRMVDLLVQLGELDEARALIDRNAFVSPGVVSRYHEPILLTRTALHGFRGDWQAAEEDLQLYFDQPWDRMLHSSPYVWLMRGLTSRRVDGNLERAKRQWAEGYRLAVESGYQDPLHTVLLGLLGETIAEQDLLLAVEQATGDGFGSQAIEVVRKRMLPDALVVSVLSNAGKSERALELFEKYQFFGLSGEDRTIFMARLGAHELFSQMILGPLPQTRELTSDEDTLLWELTGTLYEAYQNGEIKEMHLPLALTAWHGNKPVGWDFGLGRLTPECRGPLAYIFGCHFERLGRDRDAAAILETALRDAPSGSLLEKILASR